MSKVELEEAPWAQYPPELSLPAWSQMKQLDSYSPPRWAIIFTIRSHQKMFLSCDCLQKNIRS